jgi:hypothetical protein
MFIAFIGYASYGVFLWIFLHSVIADIGDNEQPAPPPPFTLVCYNEGLLYSTLETRSPAHKPCSWESVVKKAKQWIDVDQNKFIRQL